MAVLIAQSRRLDRFQEPLLPSHRAACGARASAGLERRRGAAHLSGRSPRRFAGRGGRCACGRRPISCLSRMTKARASRRAASGWSACSRSRVGSTAPSSSVRLPEGGLSLLLAALVAALRAARRTRSGRSPPNRLGRGLPLLLRAAGLDRSRGRPILVALWWRDAADEDAQLVRQLDLFDITVDRRGAADAAAVAGRSALSRRSAEARRRHERRRRRSRSSRPRSMPAGRLTMADPELAALHARAGGEEGGALAVPADRLGRAAGASARHRRFAPGDRGRRRHGPRSVGPRPARRRGSRAGDHRLEGCAIRTRPLRGRRSEREEDFLRAAAEWTWQTDEGAALHRPVARRGRRGRQDRRRS